MIDEKVSVQSAARDYGVAIGADGALDVAETAAAARRAPGRRMTGDVKSTLDTPALLVDLDVMEANIAHIAKTCRDHGVAWRPHFKGHKTLEIARKQLAAGAIGITCAKLGEAEVLADRGHSRHPDRQPDRGRH